MRVLKQQTGVTLVELMVALAIGVLLLLGVGLLFSQNRQSYLQNEEIARMQENARLVLGELATDISMAGFYGEVVDRTRVNVTSLAQLNHCQSSTTRYPNWFPEWFWFIDPSGGIVDGAVRVATGVTSAEAQQAFSCVPDAVDGTDIIGVRRTSGTPSFWDALSDGSGLVLPPLAPFQTAPTAGIYFRENGEDGRLFSGTEDAASVGMTAPYEDWEYTPRVYYVRNTAVDGRQVATLCRQRPNNAISPVQMVEECLAQGVEDLRVLIGVDVDGDGAADAYVSTDRREDLALAVSVRIYVLMRSIRPDPGYVNQNTYAYGGKNFTPPPGDRFHRRVYSTTVALRNLNNIRRLGF